jgi:biopolymer transport protein ExbD
MMQGIAKNTRRAMRRAKRRRGTELNIVSMIDVLTVLVFFLLVNQIGVSILGIDLPGPAVASAEPPKQDLSVIVRPDALTLSDSGRPIGHFAHTDSGYDLAGLVTQLATLKQQTPDDDRISLLLEPGIPYETLVALMDAVRTDSTSAGANAAELFPEVSVGVAPPAAASNGAAR